MTGTLTAIVAHRFWRRTLNRETNSSTYGIASVIRPSLVTPETVHHSLIDLALLTKRFHYSTIMAAAHGLPSLRVHAPVPHSGGSADCHRLRFRVRMATTSHFLIFPMACNRSRCVCAGQSLLRDPDRLCRQASVAVDEWVTQEPHSERLRKSAPGPLPIRFATSEEYQRPERASDEPL